MTITRDLEANGCYRDMPLLDDRERRVVNHARRKSGGGQHLGPDNTERLLLVVDRLHDDLRAARDTLEGLRP